MGTSDVVIAGAGIIGLSAALELRRHGLSVTVLDRGSAMREASWAAAGMLAAYDPENPTELRDLANLSLALYPAFLATVEQLSGFRVPLRTALTLQATPGHPSADQLLDASALRKLVPDLVAGGRRFLVLEEQSLDPRDLCRALPLAARAAGITLHENMAVRAVAAAGNVLQVETLQGPEFTARHYVHCCGAWSASLGSHGTGTDTDCPVMPRKGQMLAVTMPGGAAVLEHVIRTPELYLVPRGDGRIVVGATVESAGFDRSVSEPAIQNLLAGALALWPPLARGVITERWTGLRPGTPDSLPILDAGPDLLRDSLREDGRGAWIATGHFRNGILLAPGTARVLRRLVLGQRPEIDLTAFRLGRFAAIEAAS